MQGKLVEQDPNDESVEVLLEKIRAEKQKLFEEGKIKKKDLDISIVSQGDDNSYYGNIPMNWVVIKLKVEHVEIGYFDIYSKGGKIRRLYIPKKLRNSCLSWLESENRRSGYLFLNKFNEPITARGVAQQLKNYADKYKMNPKVIYPHSFRHLFAKNFLAKYNDIALLADLMGHESIETTRIYLRKTATEQQNIVDKIVNW
ncbi:integrase/recombinase, phage integrase family [Streptococcus pneumoniae]|nr:integrase/recombinase, phage integrase family [Streptococcus pneumoniae]VOT52328.1 integrase/recombinase, phage integrase family [Streptococcus pneumoniae]VPZ90341.1 integrase/recombinase, phage integrase family [Streptococcus pneumoniae]